MEAGSTTVAGAQRSRGELRLGIADGRLRRLRQSGASKLLFPRAGASEAVIVNTAGGITGGDRYDIDVDVAGSPLTVTTQACERIYRRAGGPPATVRTRLDLGPGARMHWLPQETILFDGAALDRRLDVAMATDAQLILAEALVFGRLARGETVRHLSLRDRIRVERDGRPIFRDGIDMEGDAAAEMSRAAIGGGAGAVATLIAVLPGAEGHLAPVRRAIGAQGGASVREGLLVARILGEDGYDLRRALVPALGILTGAPVPQVWRL